MDTVSLNHTTITTQPSSDQLEVLIPFMSPEQSIGQLVLITPQLPPKPSGGQLVVLTPFISPEKSIGQLVLITPQFPPKPSGGQLVVLTPFISPEKSIGQLVLITPQLPPKPSGEKDSDGIPSETRTPHSQTKQSESTYVDDTVLHRVLYGQWPEWNGQRPPEKIRNALLKTVPASILSNVPEEVFLDMSTLPQQGVGVFARGTIEEKTVFGPLPGRLLHPTDCTEEDLSNAWEQISDECGQMKLVWLMGCSVTHERDSWMTLIQTARHTLEQNLETSENGGAIYYRATKNSEQDFFPIDSVKWNSDNCYSTVDCYNKNLSNILHLNERTKGDVNALIKISRFLSNQAFISPGYPEEGRKRVRCVICHKGFNSRSNLRSHMRTHTQQKPFECDVCRRRFSQSSTLRNHTRLHTGEKPYKCSTCKSSYSQLAGLRAHQKSSQPKLRLPEVQTI
ncbi:unnamed protein product [Larinioides sclopetarius]|uniref:C2H2-type domain-containing protein n=1 Tax=Larinioides sclopetarius TaxID=280406 RepID=A0AAV2A3D9_9ARAC